ncbi:hypothetical protein F53441_1842 [Fusarium austroafricanum]|uniref:Uncharacterized protein n=1 Tax=Fusarium austroafricanum TaxID=2364996 RepID=A0A8H4KR31_9HYPO|nr:hypothetical protein F53441_1842 [Fusarium austroafricanum]
MMGQMIPRPPTGFRQSPPEQLAPKTMLRLPNDEPPMVGNSGRKALAPVHNAVSHHAMSQQTDRLQVEQETLVEACNYVNHALEAEGIHPADDSGAKNVADLDGVSQKKLLVHGNRLNGILLNKSFDNRPRTVSNPLQKHSNEITEKLEEAEKDIGSKGRLEKANEDLEPKTEVCN